MESKITTNFEAKTEQKIDYPAYFGRLSRAVGKFLWPGTNFMCWAITKLKFWVYFEPPRLYGSAEKWIWMVGEHICIYMHISPAENRVILECVSPRSCSPSASSASIFLHLSSSFFFFGSHCLFLLHYLGFVSNKISSFIEGFGVYSSGLYDRTELYTVMTRRHLKVIGCFHF